MKLKYGEGFISVPEKLLEAAELLMPLDEPDPISNPQEAILQALKNPIGTTPLNSIAQEGDRVCIIVSDITRPVPTHILLPPLLAELDSCGVEQKDITIVFALGIHRRMTNSEKERVLGTEVFSKYRTADPVEYVNLGITTRGTPIDVCKEAAEADVIILTGNIEFHYFAGYSGGFKALMPGISSRRAIENNHQMMLDPCSYIGAADGNPVREDIEEFGRRFKSVFVLNVLLNSAKDIIGVVAGDPVQAHRKGCKMLDRIFKVRVAKEADLVIVSAGGYPKDIDLYQAQKCLENAARIIKEGGVIVLVTELRDGFGEKVFEDWLVQSNSLPEITDRIREKFILGGHKAAAIAKVLQKADVFLLSSLDHELVKNIFLNPIKDLNEIAAENFSTIYIMPYGGQTLPELNNN